MARIADSIQTSILSIFRRSDGTLPKSPRYLQISAIARECVNFEESAAGLARTMWEGGRGSDTEARVSRKSLLDARLRFLEYQQELQRVVDGKDD